MRCGWKMGQPALNCQNDDTPHRFPSQLRDLQEAVALSVGGDITIIEGAVPQEIWDGLHERGLVSTHSYFPGGDPETGSTAAGIEYLVERLKG